MKLLLALLRFLVPDDGRLVLIPSGTQMIEYKGKARIVPLYSRRFEVQRSLRPFNSYDSNEEAQAMAADIRYYYWQHHEPAEVEVFDRVRQTTIPPF